MCSDFYDGERGAERQYLGFSHIHIVVDQYASIVPRSEHLGTSSLKCIGLS
jgi:hypothetical protein